MGIFKRIFYNDGEITEKQYRISRIGFVLESMCANPLTTLATGPYIAGLFTYLGASEALTGTIMSIASFAGITQVISPIVAERLSRRKLVVCLGSGFVKFLLAFMMLLPILIPNKTVALAMAIVCFLGFYFSNAFVSPLFNTWFISLVPKDMRGKYFGIKDSMTYVSVAVLGYVGGCVVDSYAASGGKAMGFFALGCMLMILATLDFGSYLTVSEPVEKKENGSHMKIGEILTEPFKNARFRHVLAVYILYSVATGLSNSLFSIYKVSRLELSYEFISLVTSVGIAIRIIVSTVWGRISSKKSWFFSLKYAFIALGSSMAIWLFITKENAYWAMWVDTVLSQIGWGSIGLAIYGFQFDLMPKKNTTAYVSCNGVVAGAVAFLSGLISSNIIGITNGATISLMPGLSICDMQVFFLISTLFCYAASAYVAHAEKTINRQKGLEG